MKHIALSYIINHICGEGAHPLWLKNTTYEGKWNGVVDNEIINDKTYFKWDEMVLNLQ